MYNPTHFKNADLPKLQKLIETHSFATVITTKNGHCAVSHLPLLLDRNRGKYGTLKGHIAKANPHWKDLESADILCIFHGPHGYISPSWYVDPLNVPTWNYAVVHVRGQAKLFHEESKIEEILTQLVDHHESRFGQPWKYELPDDFRSSLAKAIVGFEIEILSIEGKFKLSQNRSEQDWKGALNGVERHYGKTNPELVSLMAEEFRIKQ